MGTASPGPAVCHFAVSLADLATPQNTHQQMGIRGALYGRIRLLPDLALYVPEHR